MRLLPLPRLLANSLSLSHVFHRRIIAACLLFAGDLHMLISHGSFSLTNVAPVVCGHINGRGTVCVVSRHICRLPSRKLHFVKERQTSSAHARHEKRQGKERHRQVRREGRERRKKEEQQSTGNLVWQFELCLPV